MCFRLTFSAASSMFNWLYILFLYTWWFEIYIKLFLSQFYVDVKKNHLASQEATTIYQKVSRITIYIHVLQIQYP